MKKCLKNAGKNIFSLHFFLFDSKLDHNSALHAKIREKSLVIESRIEFPDPMLITLDTPHGSNTKFLKKCGENEWEN